MQKQKLARVIYDDLRVDILGRTYRDHEALPSIAVLSKQYGVGRNAVREALKSLEEEGLILQEKGRNAIVTFDVKRQDAFSLFLAYAMGKAPYIQDVFDVMEMIIPEFAQYCLMNAAAKEHEQLKLMIRNLRSFQIDDSHIWVKKLGGIYKFAFSIGKNELIDDLFAKMLRYIYIVLPPNILKEADINQIESVLPSYISQILTYLILGDYEKMKESIRLLLTQFSKGTTRVLQRYLHDGSAVIDQPFHWDCRKTHEKLYSSVLNDIMTDIDQGIYQAELPSMQQLAKKYRVSVRTIKNAIQCLNDYHIVQTINGVGSFVSVTPMTNQESYDPFVTKSIQEYYQAIVVLELCIKGIQERFFQQLQDEEREQIIEELKQQSHHLTPLLHHMFQMSACLQDINQGLAVYMQWNLCIRHLIAVSDLKKDFGKLKLMLITALQKKQYKKCMQITQEFMEATHEMVKLALLKVEDVKAG